MNNLSKMLIIVLIATLSACTQPTAKEILKKSYEKCQSIENGYYEISKFNKNMTSKDTSLSTYKCHFKKLEEDSIFNAAFHYIQYNKGEYINNVLYNGNELVGFKKSDSSGTITSKELWAKHISDISHNYTFYMPVISNNSMPLPNDSSFLDSLKTFKLLNQEPINDIMCYKVSETYFPDIDTNSFLYVLKIEKVFWISKEDFIPLQYSESYDIVMNNDTMYQYDKYILTKYEFNNLKDDEESLQIASIPSYINLEDYQPRERKKLVAIENKAPDWSLVSLKDDTLKLSDFKGELVLIDFFYKSCYPCILALPALQDLHEKYNDKGLNVIGINPYDTKEEDEIDKFMQKHGVTYTILLNAKDVASDYNVRGYPTMYLIDKEGNVLSTQTGYGEGVEKELEEVIKDNL